MTTDKDFKKVVRARMAKTGESYAAAHASLIAERRSGAVASQVRVNTETDDTICNLAVDGRWAASSPSAPGLIGYGPSKEYAKKELSEVRWAKEHRCPPPDVLMLIETKDGRWTARGSEKVNVVGNGRTQEQALEDLRYRVGVANSHLSRPMYTRRLTFKEHQDGRWSVTSGHPRQIGWGRDRNEAEIDLLRLEWEEKLMNDFPEDFSDYPGRE